MPQPIRQRANRLFVLALFSLLSTDAVWAQEPAISLETAPAERPSPTTRAGVAIDERAG